MNMVDIKKVIVKEVASRKGYSLQIMESKSTDSVYFKLFYNDSSLIFRVSDHHGKSNIKTLRVDKKTTKKSVEGFIDNRCRDLGRRSVERLFARLEETYEN